MKNTITLLTAFREYRVAMLHMSQSEIAFEIGVTQAHYSNFEAGKTGSSKIMKWFFEREDFVIMLYNSIGGDYNCRKEKTS